MNLNYFSIHVASIIFLPLKYKIITQVFTVPPILHHIDKPKFNKKEQEVCYR